MRDLDRDYQPITISTPEQQQRIEAVRNRAKALAYTIYKEVPGSREQSLALSRIEEALLWAMAGIVRNHAPGNCPFCHRTPSSSPAWPDSQTGPNYCNHSIHNPDNQPIPEWAKEKIHGNFVR